MNLKTLSDDQLHEATKAKARAEREITISLLQHLNEVELRHLYSKFKCTSLHGYCVQELLMSSAQAGRRVSSARMVRELPIVESKILEGTLNITSVSQANTFFNKEAANGNRFDKVEKLEILNQIETHSTRKVDKILLAKTETPEIHFRETVKPKTDKLTEIKIIVDEDTLNDLERLKDIWSNAMPNATLAQIIKRAASLSVEKTDPLKKSERAVDRKARATQSAENSSLDQEPTQTPKATRAHDRSRTTASTQEQNVAQKRCSAPAPEQRSRAVPAAVKNEVWVRDRGACTFKDPRTGENCGSKKFIELDHIVPFAKGGEATVENLRLRCRTHNHRHALEQYGWRKMNSFRAWH